MPVYPRLAPFASRLRSARRLAWLLVAMLATLACGEDPPAPPPIETEPETLRSTALGDVIGFRSAAGAHVWRGLPFAKPPLAALRWRAPQPPEPWAGLREALEFGSPCIQFAGPGAEDVEAGAVTGSEDCLYLNVYAPPTKPADVPRGTARLPVMMWIHGGGNTIGDAHIYDASTLAVDQNVVVVTVHYRMGAFGWLYHEALHGDDATLDDRSGNFGTLDTIAALRWIQDHISVFGGDPTRVTVFGESAGGTNVFALLLSPRANGLFHRAIVQSGGGWTVPIAEARNPVDAEPAGHDRSSSELLYLMLEQEGRASGRDAAKALADGMSAREIATFLRGLSAEQVMRPLGGSRLGGMYSWPGLVRDGVVLPDVPSIEAFAAGRYNAVPAIFGSNRDENKLFMAFDSPDIARVAMVPLWFKNERMYDLGSEFAAKSWKARGADEAADAIARSGRSRAWVYRFDWDELGRFMWIDLARLFGAAHALELPFVFGTLNLGPASDVVFTDESRPGARTLADTMMDYWGRFARTGDPGGEGAPAPWPAWKAGAGRFIVFDSEADDGLRLSSETVTRESVVQEVLTDARFESDIERCTILGSLVVWGENLTERRYREVLDGACAEIALPDRG